MTVRERLPRSVPPRARTTSVMAVAVVSMCLISLGACDDDTVTPIAPVTPEAGAPPQPVLNVSATTSRDSIRIDWSAAAGADGYRLVLVSRAGTLTREVTGATTAVFAQVPDNATYTVNVFALNAHGEIGGSTTTVTTNHFPWDEFYPTSLHYTRAGKDTWFSAKNGGFGKQMPVPASDLYPGCQGCHRADQPLGTKGCESCHDTPTPVLGATVDASLDGVCGKCHNRSIYEAKDHGYSDVHRDVAGFTCMSCHTMGDVHGDGVEYASMFEDGAIDAKCENCHEDRENHLFHSAHAETLDCAVCHMQTVISCYNCHMEGALRTPPEKRARRRVMDWKFMVNRNGKVTPANVVTLTYGTQTFAAFAPYYSHTIARDAVTACDDCHRSANVVELERTGRLAIATYDPATTNVVTKKGIIPVPYNYEEALKFDFLAFDRPSGTWSLLKKDGPDRFQMLYATPLTREQMAKLR